MIPPEQSGQAALEALISMLVVAVLWVGIAWLGRIQDMALHASHAARYSAFVVTRHDTDAPAVPVRAGFFQGSGNQWSDRHGKALPDTVYQDINLTFERGNPAAAHTQIGGADSRLVQLREDWHSADKGVLSAQVSLAPRARSAEQAGGQSLLKLDQLDAAYPLIHRHTSILTDSAHSSDDAAAADRIASSDLAWSGSVENSYRLGRRVASVASGVDAAWSRPQPVFDWLQPWADQLPQHHLRSLP